MKKAQIEIVGLLVIVILVVLVLFFIISFSLSNQSDTPDITKDFIDHSLINGFSLALLETSSGCAERNFKELLDDCVTNQMVSCYIEGSQVNSCVYAKHEIEKILNDTLLEMGVDYSFRVSVTGMGEQMRIETEECEISPIPYDFADFALRQGFRQVHIFLRAC